ncbi:hypothetical protein AVEN_164125-1 [Araneus ventricosus]|uniref:Uncharacterized protein n=1 Tax=Araneus ventricosus TaxID=182803 RepID=A0A4Y2QNK5_ARAVE|nr:hypothetical protein AVEN_164125-1 [Araneus ventricosus]
MLILKLLSGRMGPFDYKRKQEGLDSLSPVRFIELCFRTADALSTDTLSLALRRSICVEGSSIIYSDNGTNFIGNGQLSETNNLAALETSFTSLLGMAPPAAPWWGGFGRG